MKPLTVYWRTDCSSCMRVKEFLAQRGYAFRSVNVLEEPAALQFLAARGIRSIPVVQRGDDEFVFAQFLDDVAAFLDAAPPARSRLDPQQMQARLLELLRAAERYTRQLPDAKVHEVNPVTQRAYGDIAFHVFRIVESFVDGAQNGYLRDEMILATIPPSMRSAAQVADYGRAVIAQLQAWWNEHGSTERWQREIRTDYGDKALWDVFERSTWHAAQHVRQLMSLWQEQGIALDAPLGPEAFDGLPVPVEVRDPLQKRGDPA